MIHEIWFYHYFLETNIKTTLPKTRSKDAQPSAKFITSFNVHQKNPDTFFLSRAEKPKRLPVRRKQHLA